MNKKVDSLPHESHALPDGSVARRPVLKTWVDMMVADGYELLPGWTADDLVQFIELHRAKPDGAA